MNVYEHARNYIAQAPSAISGQGGHDQTLSVACSLVKGFDFAIAEARPLLLEYNDRCQPPWSSSELEHKLQSADKLPDCDKWGNPKPRGWLRNDRGAERSTATQRLPQSEAVAPPPEATYAETKLQKFAAPWRAYVDTAWLADRSTFDPYGMSSADFLAAIFKPGEHAIAFTDDKSQGQAVWPDEELPVTGKNGVWFLNQPVDGNYHPNPRNVKEGVPQPSRRSEESVTDWRYLVIESDKANPRDWLAALVQLPLAIAAIYTSGSRSIHALVQVDAPSKHEWDAIARAMRPILVTLGADKKSLTAVRLTRLPGCLRQGKTIEERVDGRKRSRYEQFARPKLQKLLYVNPEPEPVAVCTMAKRRDVLGPLKATAEAILGTPAAEIIERAGASDLNGCIAALEAHEAARIEPKAAWHALRWFESSKTAADLIRLLRERRLATRATAK